MQTFTVKIVGEQLTEKEIREAIWQCTDLGRDEILVEAQ